MNARNAFFPKDLYKDIVFRIRDIWQEQSEYIAKIILEEKCSISSIDLVVNSKMELPLSLLEELDIIVNRLNKHEPLQYILGYTYFFDRKFFVNNATLIPRPETEELVQLVMKKRPHNSARILDIGTGSGCIAISLALDIPESEIWAIDISRDAVSMAGKNAEMLNAPVEFIVKDILTEPMNLGSFDAIVSNPPYVTNEEAKLMEKSVLDYEPSNALFVPDNEPLRYYSRIIKIGKEALNHQGLICFEINEMFGKEVKNLLAHSGFAGSQCIQDIHGKDRFVYGYRDRSH